MQSWHFWLISACQERGDADMLIIADNSSEAGYSLAKDKQKLLSVIP